MTPDDDVRAAKVTLRTHYLARRQLRSPAERTETSAAVAAALLEGLAGVHTLAAFCPGEQEPGHGRLPAVFSQLGARVLLPVVGERDGELRWAVDSGRLAPGRFGVLEPVGPRLGATAVGTADVVIVPALAVTGEGVRLGRGGGYYDRALRLARPGAVLVAVVFDDEVADELPVAPHDERVTEYVTPSGGWQATSQK